MALTAPKSSGPAGRISTVVPSAKSAYTWPDPTPACAVLTAVSLSPGSEARAGDAGVGVGVAEAIADGYDTLDVPDLAHDDMAQRGGVRISLQGHDASLDRHRELARGGPELLTDHVVGDLLADLLIRAVEDRQHVGPADDPGEPAAGVGDGEPLDLEGIHQPGGHLDRVFWGDGYRRVSHQVTRGEALGPVLLTAVQHVGAQDLPGQHVGLGDHPDHLPVIVDHGKRAHPGLTEPGRHLLEGRAELDRHDLSGHGVLHACLHRYHPFRIGSGISRAGSWIGPEADCGVRAVEDRQRVGSADDPG